MLLKFNNQNPDLFSGNPHIVLHSTEHCWLDKVALIPMTTTATFQFGPILLTSFDKVQDLVELLFINLKTNILLTDIKIIAMH